MGGGGALTNEVSKQAWLVPTTEQNQFSNLNIILLLISNQNLRWEGWLVYIVSLLYVDFFRESVADFLVKNKSNKII